MITESDIIHNQIASYEDYYGLDFNQSILTQISLENHFFNGKNVETILNIFLFEKFDNDDCYLDDKKQFVNYDYLKKHPCEIKNLINENKHHY